MKYIQKYQVIFNRTHKHGAHITHNATWLLTVGQCFVMWVRANAAEASHREEEQPVQVWSPCFCLHTSSFVFSLKRSDVDSNSWTFISFHTASTKDFTQQGVFTSTWKKTLSKNIILSKLCTVCCYTTETVQRELNTGAWGKNRNFVLKIVIHHFRLVQIIWGGSDQDIISHIWTKSQLLRGVVL